MYFGICKCIFVFVNECESVYVNENVFENVFVNVVLETATWSKEETLWKVTAFEQNIKYNEPQHKTAQRMTARRSVTHHPFFSLLSYPPVLCFTLKKAKNKFRQGNHYGHFLEFGGLLQDPG